MCPTNSSINVHVMLIEMNNQIARLRDFNRSLQDQFTSANLKIVFLVKKQTTEIQEYQASKYSLQ